MRKFSKFAMSAVIVCGLTLSGCQTGKSPTSLLTAITPFDEIIKLLKGPSSEELAAKTRKAELRKLPILDPKRWDDQVALWQDVAKASEAQPLSDQRVRIKAKGSIFGGPRHSETNFFIRAAGETKRSGYDGFVIVHMDYFSTMPKLISLTPSISFSSRRWIGNYEDFRENLNEQNMFSSKKKAGKKTMDGVILMLNKDEFRNRDRFNAEEIYLNYLAYEDQWNLD